LIFEARWTGPARRDLSRLPARSALAILVFVDERLVDQPYRRSKELSGELAGRRSARNGDYRIILTVDDAEQIVWIHRVDHRAQAYRTR